MASRRQRTVLGWILFAFSLTFMLGNGFFMAEYAIDLVGIPLVWYVVASNFIVWGLGCTAIAQFKSGVDDDIELRGKYQNIATMASIADHLATKDDRPESPQIRHRIVSSLLRIGVEHLQPEEPNERNDQQTSPRK